MHPHDLEYAAIRAHELSTLTSRHSPDHGPRHWRDVARLGYAIRNEDADLTVVFLFAALHDTQRMSEFEDPDHGDRAAKIAMIFRREGTIKISQRAFDELDLALRMHDVGKTSGNPTIGTCWDADRLTLSRVGIMPEAEYFSNEKIKRDLAFWAGDYAGIIMDSDDETWGDIANVYGHAY